MHNEIRRDSWSELLFASENDNRSFSQKKALSSSMLESLLRNPCAPVISQATAVGRAKLASRYLIHEKLLLAFYTRNSRSTARPVHWLSDPLAKWRDHWRVFGLVLMLLNCMAITSAAWARFRCEVNESCHEELDSCPPMITWLSKFHLPSLNLWHGKSFNCRRQVISVLSGRATQLFALSELSLGLRTAATASLYPRHAVGTHVVEAVQYGTTAGATAYALATLDLMLSLPWHASAESVPRTPPPPSTPWHALVDPLRRKLAESRPVRTLVGYRRLKALPPPPTFLGWLLDEWILPAWLGTGQEAVVNFVKALPAIGDAILEAELLQAWFASFLASAKMLVLIASVLKAARVRRKLRAIRKERAIRRIVLAMRAYVARLRVRRLQQKHAAGAVAVASLWHHVRSKPQKDTLIRPNLSAPTCLWSLDAQTRGSTRNANGSRRTRALENLKEMPYEFETESVASPSPSPRPLLASHAKSAEVERAGYISGSTESSEDAARELSTCD